jgi:uncharacterized membrane protein YkoI
MTPKSLASACLCLAIAAAAISPGDALAEGRGRRGPDRALAQPALSLDEAVARAERRHKARAVRAEEKRSGDRIEYRIRLLADDGRVFEVRVDAATGRER